MSEKYKFNFNQSSPQNILRTSFQPTTSNNFQSHNIYSNNSNINTQSIKTAQSPEAIITSPRSKNYSNSIKQLQNKFESVFSQLKKQDPNEKKSNEVIDLRVSMSNPTKKVDKQFFRKTTFNPKGYSMLSEKNNNSENSQSTNIQSQLKFNSPISNTNNLFKKNNQQEQRYQKKSPIVCGFYLGKSLGAGKFGQVYIAKHVISGFVCALKKINKIKVKEQNMIHQAIQQIKILTYLSHPNIIQCYGAVYDQQNIYIILQYMQGGTLFDYLGKKSYLQQNQAVIYMRQIIQAVKYLHEKGIIHRDIKPQNIVTSYNLAKLCDFGWATKIATSCKTYCGTFDYAAPEILQRKQYDESVDIWCLGILAYQLLVGKAPFQHKQRKIVIQKIINIDKQKIIFPEHISKNSRQFIEDLVKKNPNDRLKSNKLLDHPFLKRKQQ